MFCVPKLRYLTYLAFDNRYSDIPTRLVTYTMFEIGLTATSFVGAWST